VSTESQAQRRFVSLDVFRGAAIVAMILVNNPGDRAVTFPQLLHASWHGYTFADTIFPAFLWIVGLALALSMDARAARGASRAALLGHAARRAAILIACGLFVEGFPYFDFAHYQYTGVLQKIAVAYFLAYAICLYTDWRGRMLALIAIFAAYICFMLGVHVPECGAGPWSPECNAAKYFNDQELAGHLWEASMNNDPDGIVGSIAATASVLIGVLAGQWFRRDVPSAGAAPLARLATLALGLMLAGLGVAVWIPINKILWTPSYTLFMGGVACAAFLVVFWLVERRGAGRWLKPLEIFGLNALAAYILSRLGADVLKMHIHRWSIYHDLLLGLLPPTYASLAFAIVNVLAVYLVAWCMYRMRIFVKL
jgi:predicted acyltransferase